MKSDIIGWACLAVILAPYVIPMYIFNKAKAAISYIDEKSIPVAESLDL